MCSQCTLSAPLACDPCRDVPGGSVSRSRRTLLKSSAAVVANAAAAQLLPASSRAQVADTELARVQGQRRILLKGGVVLTLDRRSATSHRPTC